METEALLRHPSRDPINEQRPLLRDDDSEDRAESSSKASNLTLFDAIALLVSIQIGSGIFASPSQVDKHASAPGMAILVWLVCGCLAWAGAMSYAELGSALPVSGGTQEYLKYIYGDNIAFLASWIWILAVKPCSMAVLSITFAQYWISLVFGTAVAANGWQSKLLAISALVMVVFFNMLSVDATTKMTKFFFYVKISTMMLLFVFAVLNIGFGVDSSDTGLNNDWQSKDWFGSTNPDWQPGFFNAIGQTVIGVYAGLWAYSGWDNANMVAGDMRDIADLPTAINTAVPLVILSFVLANVCYYFVVPWSEIDNTNTIAVTLGTKVFGWGGGAVFAVLVSLACLGGINVNVFTTSRLIVSAARANWFPRPLEKFSSLPSIPVLQSREENHGALPVNKPSSTTGRASTRNNNNNNQTPIRAMLFSFCVTTIYILLGTFGTLITFIGLCEYTFFFLTISGLLVLRFREPELRRPYKPIILLPITFAIVAFCLVVFGCVKAPIQAAILAILVLAGFSRKWNFWGRGIRWVITMLMGRKGERQQGRRSSFESITRRRSAS